VQPLENLSIVNLPSGRFFASGVVAHLDVGDLVPGDFSCW